MVIRGMSDRTSASIRASCAVLSPGRVTDTAGAAADNHPRHIGQIKILGQALLVQPDAPGPGRVQPALAQDRGELVIGGLVLGAQLQDQEGLGHGRHPQG